MAYITFQGVARACQVSTFLLMWQLRKWYPITNLTLLPYTKVKLVLRMFNMQLYGRLVVILDTFGINHVQSRGILVRQYTILINRCKHDARSRGIICVAFNSMELETFQQYLQTLDKTIPYDDTTRCAQ